MVSEELEYGADAAGKFAELTIPEKETLINNWICSERDRYILKRRLIDGKSFVKIEEELEHDPRFEYITYRQIQNVFYAGRQILYNHIKFS